MAYVLFDEVAIHGIGDTEEEAREYAARLLNTEEIAGLRVAECTEALADRVRGPGGDPCFDWIKPGPQSGILGLCDPQGTDPR